jgi:hypothetical protein
MDGTTANSFGDFGVPGFTACAPIALPVNCTGNPEMVLEASEPALATRLSSEIVERARKEPGRGGHSGLIVAVSGSNLYTIEGNIDNKVVRRRILNWRDRPDIDGIGIRHMPSAVEAN